MHPNEFTILDLAKTVIKLTKSSSEIVLQPLPHYDPLQRKPDISLAKSNLGWETGVKLKEGLLETIGYFEELIRGCIWRLKTLTQWNEISISKDRGYMTTVYV